VKQFFLKRWFLITLVVVMALGICLCKPLQPLSELKAIRNGLVAVVLFLMALPLEASAMWRSMRRPWPPLLAVGVNFGLLPLFAWGLSQGLEADFAAGLLVAATTPCTLASASVWTRRAGGNDAVSILVTIITNLLCFVVQPLWLLWMTGESVDSPELSLAKMTTKLGLLVLLPMTIAQLLRLYKPLGDWATKQKPVSSVLAQCGILSMVFLGAIRVGLRLSDPAEASMNALDVIAMLVAVCVVHVTMLWTGVGIARVLRFTREDQIAVAFAGSQKTLTVGLLVAMSLQVSILPMVWYHVSQLFIDTLIADRFKQSEKSASADTS
jgi:sodium/bile acid cotransporter 7